MPETRFGRIGNMVLRLIWALVLAPLFFIGSWCATDARVLQLRDLRAETTFFDPSFDPNLSSLAISHDGKSIACILSTPNFSNDTNEDRIVLVDIAKGTARTLVSRMYELNQMRWTPSGKQLTFLAKKNLDDSVQIFAVSPLSGKAVALTAAAGGVEDYAWRPDGQALVFSTPDSTPQPSGEQRFVRAFDVHDNDYLTTEAPLPSHLWMLSSASGGPHRLTSGTWSIPKRNPILPQHFPNDFFSWSADGAALAFTKTPNAYLADDDRAVIQVLNLRSRSIRKLTGHRGLESGGEFSPYGARIAYWYPKNGSAIAGSEIYVTSAAGGEGTDVTRNLDRSPWLVRWMPDGRSLLVLAHDGIRESMFVVGIDGTVRKIDAGALSVSLAGVGPNGAIAFVASGPQSPSELYYLTSRNAVPRKLTGVNAYFSRLQLGAVRSITWQGPDGFTEDGVLTYPPGFVRGKRYPLVLQIHGWPAYASQAAFDTDYAGLAQLLAAHGYLVFEPNYRGSDNLGNAYEMAILDDAGDGPGRDVMTGVWAVEKLGIVDEGRIGVSGWSYGGFMTAWLISHYNIWKAAMVGAAPTNTLTDYAIGDYNVLDRHYFGASPWSSKTMWQHYLDQSIMPYAWNIHTPTLILSDTGDVEVPITHSYELFHALRDRGVPVSFVAYASSEHFPSDPLKSQDIFRRWVAWFDRYLR